MPLPNSPAHAFTYVCDDRDRSSSSDHALPQHLNPPVHEQSSPLDNFFPFPTSITALLLALWIDLPVSAIFTDGKLRTGTTKTLENDVEKLWDIGPSRIGDSGGLNGAI